MNFFKKLFRKAERKERLNVYIVKKLHPAIKAHVKYETEHGILLPQDFKRDPAAWLNVLRNIEYAFDELHKEYSGEMISLKKESMTERAVKIQKGFELFGKYLMELN